jgi:hypothetical protein
MKKLIQKLIRESLLLREAEDDIKDDKMLGDEKENKEDEESEEEEDRGRKDYSDVQNALDKDKNPLAPSQVGVMVAIGIHDDKKGVNRSLFGKKLHQEKIDGVLYQFGDEELDKVRVQLGIK